MAVNEQGYLILQNDDDLSAEFKHRIGLLQEEEDLSDAFKARLGLGGLDGMSESHEISIALDWETDTTISSFKFTKYTKKNFQGGNTGKWQKDPLKQPLLPKNYEMDVDSSIAVFLAIQRYMGDLPPGRQDRERTPVMTKIFRTIQIRTQQATPEDVAGQHNGTGTPPMPENVEGFKVQKKSSMKKLLSRRKSSSSEQKDQENQNGQHNNGQTDQKMTRSLSTEEKLDPADILDRLPGNELDLIHFIVGYGILRRHLRDEILCQICKQLTENPKKESQRNGWILLTLCLGSFLPTDGFRDSLKCFIKDAPVDFKATLAESAKNAMRRTLATGPRYHPPNWLEYTALKMRKAVMIPVTLADGAIHTIEIDAATTSEEMCHTIGKKIGLKERFGFSVYICIYDKVSSLGSGTDHVMDAIAECEQIVRSKGQQEEDAPWRLYFRKELFSPWSDAHDEYANILIFNQLIKGLRTREYRIKEADTAQTLAKVFFLEYNGNIVPGKIQQDLLKYLPSKYLEGEKSRDHWTQAIMSAVHTMELTTDRVSPKDVMEQFIKEASSRWVLQFSGLFEAYCMNGPPLPRNDVVVAINHEGLFVMHEPFKVAASVEYPLVVDIFASRTTKEKGQTFTFTTLRGEEFCFLSPNAQNVTTLVATFIEGLRRRSRYAVGVKDFHIQAGEEREPFDFKQGDVLILLESEPDGAPKKSEWVKGQNERTGRKGIFPLDAVYVVPTLEKPTADVTRLIKTMNAKQTMTLPRRKGRITLAPLMKDKKGMEKDSKV